MKLKNIVLPSVLCMVFSLAVVGSVQAGAKWKGNWYLQGAHECKQIELDGKGKSTMGTYPRSIVEKKNGNLYLTVESMGKKYSYKMEEGEKKNTDYRLDLISVGPNLPVPETKAAEGAYRGIYRLMVDCQTMLAGVQESTLK